MKANFAPVLFLWAFCVSIAFVECQDKELLKLFGVKKNARRQDVYVRKAAPEGVFGSYVSLRALDMHYCAATLFSQRYILTSASCVDPAISVLRIKNPTANIGTYELEPEDRKCKKGKKSKKSTCEEAELDLEIDKIIVHEDYSNGTRGRPPYDAKYDIALLRLKRPSNRTTARLPIETPDCCDEADFVSVGFGRASSSGPFAKTLEMAAFPFLDAKSCTEGLKESSNGFVSGKLNRTAASSICVGGAGEYCQPDEGSALFRYSGKDEPLVLMGFATRATGGCSYGHPYVFANVSFHMPWILGVRGVVEDMTRSDVSEILAGGVGARVSGSVDAQFGRYPYAVSIREQASIHICHGVLIGPGHVLTTCSCAGRRNFPNPGDLMAYIGGFQIDTDETELQGEVRFAKEVICHKRSNPDTHSIALSKYSSTTSFEKALYMALALDRDCCRNDTDLIVIGWGAKSTSNAFEPTLQNGVMTFISKKICRNRYGLRDLNPVSVCAGGQSAGASLCRGDHGVPLILPGGAEDVLIGIGFENSNSTSCDRPAEFIRIAFFLKWIREITEA